jgi:hypothetical protein
LPLRAACFPVPRVQAFGYPVGLQDTGPELRLDTLFDLGLLETDEVNGRAHHEGEKLPLRELVLLGECLGSLSIVIALLVDIEGAQDEEQAAENEGFKRLKTDNLMLGT